MSDLLPLKDLADLSMGETIISADCDGSGYPIFSADTSDAPWNWSSKIKRINKSGTLVVGARGSIGFPRLPRFESFGATQTTITISPDRARIFPEFLFYALSRYDFKAVSAQQAVPMLTVAELGTVAIRCLPLPEQYAVAGVLGALDTAIRETEAIIAKLKAVKQGLLHDLLTRGIDANGELRPPQAEAPHLYKQSPLGWIPREWTCHRLEDITSAPICYGIVQVLGHVPDGVPVLAIRDLLGDFTNGIHRTARSIDAAYPRSRVRPGDVLVSIKGTIGRVGVVPAHYEGNISRDIGLLRPNESMRSGFMVQLLRSPIGQRTLSLAQVGTTRAELSIAPLKKLLFAVPTIAEQGCIEAALAACDEKLTAESAQLAILRSQKIGLMDDLLTGRVRVTPLLSAEPQAQTRSA